MTDTHGQGRCDQGRGSKGTAASQSGYDTYLISSLNQFNTWARYVWVRLVAPATVLCFRYQTESICMNGSMRNSHRALVRASKCISLGTSSTSHDDSKHGSDTGTNRCTAMYGYVEMRNDDFNKHPTVFKFYGHRSTAARRCEAC